MYRPSKANAMKFRHALGASCGKSDVRKAFWNKARLCGHVPWTIIQCQYRLQLCQEVHDRELEEPLVSLRAARGVEELELGPAR